MDRRRPEQPVVQFGTAVAALDPSRIPVIVPVFENPTFAMGMVGQLLRFPALAPVLVDNGSTFAPMVALLDLLAAEVPVIRLGANRGPRLVMQNPAWLEALPRHFCLTDPDLCFNPDLPPDFHATLIDLAAHSGLGKAGFALDISEAAVLRDDVYYKNGRAFTIRQQEAPFWRDQIATTEGGDPVYRAPIDTTFALYDRRFFDRAHGLRAVRVAGRFLCQHLPWRRDLVLPADEEAHYRARQRHSTYLQSAVVCDEPQKQPVKDLQP